MSETTTRHGVAWRAHLADRYGTGYSPAYDYPRPAAPGNVPGWNAWMAAPWVPFHGVESYTEQWARMWPIVTSHPPF